MLPKRQLVFQPCFWLNMELVGIQVLCGRSGNLVTATETMDSLHIHYLSLCSIALHCLTYHYIITSHLYIRYQILNSIKELSSYIILYYLYITSHCITTSHYTALHSMTLPSIIFHHNTLHCSTLNFMTSSDDMIFHFILVHYQYVALHYVAVHCSALHCLADYIHCSKLHYIT